MTEVLSLKGDRVVRARMRIDHAFKGVWERSLILFDDGMCDGPDLKLGERYLMYTRRNGKGDVPSRGCTRSRHVQDAIEDLQYLNGLGAASPTADVFGRVLERTDEYRNSDHPAAGARVEAKGASNTYTTTTDADGRYSFLGLQPGEYTITASLSGFRTLTFGDENKPPPITVQPRGCAVVNRFLRQTWNGRIAGRVFKSNGTPAAAGIDLALIRMENRNGGDWGNMLFGRRVRTDRTGAYTFREVSPGRYKIVLNSFHFPTLRRPYPAIYWPSALSESGATTIEVSDRYTENAYDFRLPPDPKSTVVRGMVQFVDSRPASGAGIVVDARLETGSDESTTNLDVDDSGSFAFTAFEGFEYTLRASSLYEPFVHSREVKFSLKKGQHPITLPLTEPGRFDNDPLEELRSRQNQAH